MLRSTLFALVFIVIYILYRPPSMSKLSLIPRRSLARGNADHGWLKSFHSFSFANYYDPKFQDFGPLRVINEDRVEPTTGFGAHSHKEFEIFSYVVNGELQHNDSMGNKEILKRGEIQMTSAGTGITHSEYNTVSNHDRRFPISLTYHRINPRSSISYKYGANQTKLNCNQHIPRRLSPMT